MLNYVKSECYRIIRQKTVYLYTMAFAGIVIAAALVLAGVASSAGSGFHYNNTRFLLLNVQTSCAVPIFCFYFLENVITGDEIRHKTLKNSLSYGISRGVIFWGKFLVSLGTVLVISILVVGSSIASGYLLLEDSGSWYLYSFLRILTGFVPLALFAIALFHVLLLLCESMNKVIALAAGIYVIIPLISKWLGLHFSLFARIYQYSPYNLLTSAELLEDGRVLMSPSTLQGMLTCWTVGLSLTAITLIAGHILFQRKDVA